MITPNVEQVRDAVLANFERRRTLSPADSSALAPLLERGLEMLDAGRIRAAEVDTEGVRVHAWVKQLILLCLMTGRPMLRRHGAETLACDKLALKFDTWTAQDFAAAALRVVPGAVVRRGAYLGEGVVLMPCFINIGAHVGASTMVDTWATIGSCAQVGARCHISGGAGIGGVLEPLGDAPVVIGDNVFIGARSEIAEGVRIRSGAVIGMGVFLGKSTPIVDRASGKVYVGEVPENAVVVPGSRPTPSPGGSLNTYAAVIVKYADARTRGKTALNFDVRNAPWQE